MLILIKFVFRGVSFIDFELDYIFRSKSIIQSTQENFQQLQNKHFAERNDDEVALMVRFLSSTRTELN